MKHIPDAALNQHIAIVGMTGSGKTFTAKGIVEHLLDKKRQTCVVDPTGAWWGLRRNADGKGRGYEVVLVGGVNADIPLAERSGAAVARLITEQFASAVIDTSGFTVGEYTRWFIDFAGTLYTTIRSPLHLVIDEAHYFMPQGGGGRVDVDAGKMLHAGNRLMSGGRSKGVRGMMITQRPAKLHKDSLTCANTLIAMRVIAPQDRKAIKEWVDGMGDPEQGKTVLDSLAQLKRGEGWVWYPEGGHLERVKFPAIKTYDSSATPEHGAKSGPGVSEINLDDVRKALADAVKEAEANDPKLLRKRIAELERMSRETKFSPTTKSASDPKAIERAVSKAVAERDREWKPKLDALVRVVQTRNSTLGKIEQLAHLNGEAKIVVEAPAAVKMQMPAIDKGRNLERVRNQPRLGNAMPKVARSSTPVGEAGDLGRGKPRDTLIALAQYDADGGLEPRRLASLVGMANGGSTMRGALAGLRTKGLITPAGVNPIRITQAGLDAAGDFEPLPTGQECIDKWRRKLGSGAPLRVFDHLVSLHGDDSTPEDIGAAAECEPGGSTYRGALARLRNLGIADRGRLAAARELFE